MAAEQPRNVAGTGASTIPGSPKNPNWKIYFTHFATGAAVAFEGWLTEFSDNFSSQWNEETAYGRMDPLVTFQRTGRKISMSFDIPSATRQESIHNTGNLDLLIKFLYPVYETGERNFNNVLKSAPLIGLKWANLVANNPADGEQLVGYLNGISYSPVLDAGFFMIDKGTKIFPQLLRVQFEFTVLHTILPGWSTVVNSVDTVETTIVLDPTEVDLDTGQDAIVEAYREPVTTVTTDNTVFGGQPRANARFPHDGNLGGGASLPSIVTDRIVGPREEMSAAVAGAILEGSNYYGQHGLEARPLPEGISIEQYGPALNAEGGAPGPPDPYDNPSQSTLDEIARIIAGTPDAPQTPASDGGYEDDIVELETRGAGTARRW